MPEIKSKNNRSRINTRILLRDNSGRNIPFFHFSEFPVSPAHRSCIGPLPFHQKHHPGHKIQDTPFPAFAFPHLFLVKKQLGKIRGFFRAANYKNNFPLKMAKAHAAAIQNRPLHGIQMPRAVLEWSKREKGW